MGVVGAATAGAEPSLGVLSLEAPTGAVLVSPDPSSAPVVEFASPSASPSGTGGESHFGMSSVESVALDPIDSTYATVHDADATHQTLGYAYATLASNTAYLKFDTSVLPDDAAIVSAQLELRVRTSRVADPGVRVQQVATGWSGSTMVWANRPSPLDTVVASVRPATAGATIDLDLSSAAKIRMDGPTAFALGHTRAGSDFSFWTTGSRAPRLVVTVAARSASSPATGTPEPSASPSDPGATASPSPSAPDATPAPGTSDPGSGTTAPVYEVSSRTTPGTLPYAVAAAGSTERKVFAHYFPPYPVSIDNADPASDYYARNYLSPEGEGGKFAQYGGLLRDRPLVRDRLSGDWQMSDMRSEVMQAAASGIDGFTVDLLSLSGSNWTRTEQLMDAAADVAPGFVVVPNLDMTASAGQSSISTLAPKLASLAKRPSAYQLPDGRFVLSSFKAEAQSVAWWKQLMAVLKSDYGVSTALVAVFLNASTTNMQSYAPISYALGNWGTRDAGTTAAGPDYTAAAHSLGVKWMMPVAVQDERPNQLVYDEAGNLSTLRAGWKRAIDDGADLVQLTTWNDYSENTAFAPSASHGWTFLVANGYYLTRFKTGHWPAITHDAVLVTHRIQPFAASPTYPQSLMVWKSSGTGTKPRDTVEVMTLLTSPAQVRVDVGGSATTASVGAGVDVVTVPLAVGRVSAVVSRSGGDVVGLTTPYTVTSHPYVQDLQYYGAVKVAE